MDGDEEVTGRGWEMVLAGSAAASSSYDGDDLSVFPPSLHEGLTPTLTLGSPSPSSSPSTSASIEGLEESKDEEVVVEEHHLSRTRISESARRLVVSGIKLVRSKLAALSGGGGGGSCDGGAVWSFAAVVGFAGVLMYMRRRHRREKQLLLFMILEKDEVIFEFPLLGLLILLQIACFCRKLVLWQCI